MKKRNQIIIAVLSFGLLLSSCSKNLDNSAVTLDLTKTGKITVVVRNETDITLAKTTYTPVANTKVTLSIANSNFNADGTGMWSETLTTDASGMIVADVPATLNGVTLNVQVLAFQGTQVQNTVDGKVTFKGYFAHDGATINIKIDDDKVLDVNNLKFNKANN